MKRDGNNLVRSIYRVNKAKKKVRILNGFSMTSIYPSRLQDRTRRYATSAVNQVEKRSAVRLSGRTTIISFQLTGRTSCSMRVKTASVFPEAATNSTYRPSGSYPPTTAPSSPLDRPYSGKSRARTTVSNSLNFITFRVRRDVSRNPLAAQHDPHRHNIRQRSRWRY